MMHTIDPNHDGYNRVTTLSNIRDAENLSHQPARKSGAYLVTQSGRIIAIGSEPRHHIIARTSRKRSGTGRIKF